MAYSTFAVANAFIERGISGQVPNLSPMKLQKLIFFAQSWCLRIFNKPLVDEFFAKWEYGPVIPSLYHAVKEYGSSTIGNLIGSLEFSENGYNEQVTPVIPANDIWMHRIIDSVVSVYGCMSAAYLSKITHLPGSAWSKANSEKSAIDNKLLKECIVTEEGRFFGARDFGVHFDLEKLKCRVNDDFVAVPTDINSIEDMDEWLRGIVDNDC
ncbi:Panacea domain-containing protein [Xenorhabdus miraniensis]|uniref:Phage-associated protein n=1 Tax=Xenorhabdus miraniensis TaxID=351674 RepID=A0A2D0JLF2_9GAMM|nr:type II toxin-antitoxin system antitoxin SocA domain-containing protein [Xenorhabdus miraniensis]PHM47074.1 phage-associated protein [Xenorhabdus miraniensis]